MVVRPWMLAVLGIAWAAFVVVAVVIGHSDIALKAALVGLSVGGGKLYRRAQGPAGRLVAVALLLGLVIVGGIGFTLLVALTDPALAAQAATEKAGLLTAESFPLPGYRVDPTASQSLDVLAAYPGEERGFRLEGTQTDTYMIALFAGSDRKAAQDEYDLANRIMGRTPQAHSAENFLLDDAELGPSTVWRVLRTTGSYTAAMVRQGNWIVTVATTLPDEQQLRAVVLKQLVVVADQADLSGAAAPSPTPTRAQPTAAASSVALSPSAQPTHAEPTATASSVALPVSPSAQPSLASNDAQAIAGDLVRSANTGAFGVTLPAARVYTLTVGSFHLSEADGSNWSCCPGVPIGTAIYAVVFQTSTGLLYPSPTASSPAHCAPSRLFVFVDPRGHGTVLAQHCDSSGHGID